MPYPSQLSRPARRVGRPSELASALSACAVIPTRPVEDAMSAAPLDIFAGASSRDG